MSVSLNQVPAEITEISTFEGLCTYLNASAKQRGYSILDLSELEKANSIYDCAVAVNRLQLQVLKRGTDLYMVDRCNLAAALIRKEFVRKAEGTVLETVMKGFQILVNSLPEPGDEFFNSPSKLPLNIKEILEQKNQELESYCRKFPEVLSPNRN